MRAAGEAVVGGGSTQCGKGKRDNPGTERRSEVTGVAVASGAPVAALDYALE